MVLITCGYRGQEFVRVGYYVNNEYDSDELKAEPPASLLLDRLQRNILADKPRVTRFPIRWDRVDELEAPLAQDDGEPLEDEQVDKLMSQDGTSDEDDNRVQNAAGPLDRTDSSLGLLYLGGSNVL